MKKQFKAIALALTLLTATSCGSNEAKVNPGVKVVKAEQTTAENNLALSNVETPKANNIEAIKEVAKAEKSVSKNYLIPQTLELIDEEKTIESQDKDEVVETKEEINQIEFIEEVVEEIEVANDQISEEIIEVASNEEAIEVVYNEEEIEPVIVEEEQVEEKVETQVASASGILEESSEANEEKETDQEKEIEETQVAGGLTVASPSVNEVKSYWKNYQSKANDTADFYGINLINPESAEIFGSNTNLDLNNIELGALSKAAQEDALHIANTARFASGIKNELRFGAEQAQYAQAATVVNRLNLQVSHSPSQPNGLDTNNFQLAAHGAANSNLASNFGLLESVVEYLKDDLGERNQTEVGHRRWVLNPAETTVGFGQTDDFTAMYVNNNQYDGENEDLVYAYPGQTAISEFHSADASLSLMFGENFDLSNAQVYVKDLATGEERNDANIDESFKGCVKAITFGQGMNFAPGTKLQVKVTGVTKNGVDYPVEYTIEYTSIR